MGVRAPRAPGPGLGAALVYLMVERGPGADFRWMLHTADAHDLYARFGFAAPGASAMERPSGPGKPPTGPAVLAG